MALTKKITGLFTGAVSDYVWVTSGYDVKNNVSSVMYADCSGFSYEYKDPVDTHNLTGKHHKMAHLLNEWSNDGQVRSIPNNGANCSWIVTWVRSYSGKKALFCA